MNSNIRKFKIVPAEEFLSACGEELYGTGREEYRSVQHAQYSGKVSLQFEAIHRRTRALIFENVLYNPSTRTIFHDKTGLCTRELTCWDRYSASQHWYYVHSCPGITFDHGYLTVSESENIRYIKEKSYLWHGHSNFGHHVWETEVALLLHNLAKENDYVFICNSETRVPELMFGENEISTYTTRVDRDKLTHFSHLLVPAQILYRDRNRTINICTDAINFFKAAWDQKLPKSKTDGKKLMFLSRAGAKHRRLLNEEDIINELRYRYCVDVFYGGQDRLQNEISLIRNTDIVIAPIGAASALTAFASSDIKVIELSPHPSIWGMYNSRVGAALFNQDYIRVNGTPQHPRSNNMLNESYHLSINDILNLLP